jgi:hypothetical protein
VPHQQGCVEDQTCRPGPRYGQPHTPQTAARAIQRGGRLQRVSQEERLLRPGQKAQPLSKSFRLVSTVWSWASLKSRSSQPVSKR